MLLSIPSKHGSLQVLEEGILRVQVPLVHTIVWQVPCREVLGFTTQPGTPGALAVTIHTTQGTYQAETIAPKNFAKLQALFPGLQTVVAGKEWYHNPAISTHVETYSDQKKMQKEVEEAGKFGWMPQGADGRNGKFSAGKAIAGGVLLGPVGLLAGAVGNKDKYTVTFVRQGK